ncbi:hypothetical protein EBS43_04290, partial [bacterium]|nr:hypothetical protein [bacterium]
SAAAGTTPISEASHYVRKHIALKIEDVRQLNADGSEGEAKKAEAFLAGEKVIYKGAPIMMTATNGISSLFSTSGAALYLNAGQILVVCRNQYIDHRDYSFREGEAGPKVLRAHFLIKASSTRHAIVYRCGSCSYRFDIVPDPTTVDAEACGCRQSPPIKPESEHCIIM